MGWPKGRKRGPRKEEVVKNGDTYEDYIMKVIKEAEKKKAMKELFHVLHAFRITVLDKLLAVALVVICGLYLSAFSIVVSWEPNTVDWDLAGYNLSYDGPTSDRWTTPCGPYEVSSLGVEYNTTYTITDASVGTYAFYVRAYDTAGNMSDYTPYACLVATDGIGGYTLTTEGISEPANCVPVASIVVDKTRGSVPMTVSFSGSSTNNPTSWSWDFDRDGIEDSTLQNDSYVYNTEGIYSPKLRAWNSTWFDDAFVTVYPGFLPLIMTGGSVSGCVIK